MRMWRLLMLLSLPLFAVGSNAADLAGSEAPDFVLKSMSGENIRLSEYRGEVVLINFWTSWCGDCRESMPALNDLYERYREVGFQVLSVNMDRKREDASEMATSLGMRHPVLFDSGRKVSKEYEVDSLPVMLLVDREGVVRHVNEGYRRGREVIYLRQLRALLRE
ncbi:MAG: TlpA disulfide reductase family protein [Gammaproteobacteria bacterium]